VRPVDVHHFCCTRCAGDLKADTLEADEDGRICTGTLVCVNCATRFPIIRYIPRFVGPDNYAASFGLEWNVHRRTQYDSHSGVRLSEYRFLAETRWPTDLDGEVIIEVGSGSGRFTAQAASTGAMVLSLDYSEAVEANYASNGGRDNVVIVQGDIYHMPFRENYADRLFCIGVLQHTPDPRRAFLSLPRHLKPGGSIVADVYAKTFSSLVLSTKYWVRPLTRRIAPERLYRVTRRYVDSMWPVARMARRIPRIGKALNWRLLLIADYSETISDDAVLREWAYLDTFDMLAPRYDSPQTLQTVKRWCQDADLVDAEISYGLNVNSQRTSRRRSRIELRGRKRPRELMRLPDEEASRTSVQPGAGLTLED
jgi:SAM-dependent methyltransferase